MMFQKLFFNLSVATALTLPITTLSTPLNAQATDQFGAIAYSEETGSHGYSYNYATQGVAQNKALNECERYAGSGDCKVLVWFKNGCGALAKAPDGAYGSGWGANTALAERYAIESCSEYGRACKVIRTVCTE